MSGKKKLFGIVGWKNTGKTTLVSKLVQDLTEQGISVSTVKHTHHEFEIDHEGKDSFIHRQSGAQEVLLTSGDRWALIHERGKEIDFMSLIEKLSPVDLILIEGEKQGDHPKISVHREEKEEEPLIKEAKNVIAIASNNSPNSNIPVLDINNISEISDFIIEHCALRNNIL